MKGANTMRQVKLEAMSKASIYRWKCPCCGPNNSKHRQEVHQLERSIQAQQDYGYDLQGTEEC